MPSSYGNSIVADYPTEDLQKYLATGVDVARTAGKEVKNAFSCKKSTETKAHAVDLVTETDKLVEKIIVKTLKEKYPTHSFIGEEETASNGKQHDLTDNPTWIIDPIDGTTNFVHSIPYAVVSIGLTIKKQLVVGVIYNPILDEMYTATKGGGAFCNGQRIHVSGQEDLSGSLFSMSVDAVSIETDLSNLRALIMAGSHGGRNFGAAAPHLCAVARGALDAYIDHGIFSWDIAAGTLLVEEAGGVVLDPANEGKVNLMSRRILAASSKKLASTIASLVTTDFP